MNKKNEDIVDCVERYGGLPVLACLPGSSAAASGIRGGDVVFEVNGIPIDGVDSYVQARQMDSDTMHVRLRRNGEVLSFTLQLASSKMPPINAIGKMVC